MKLIVLNLPRNLSKKELADLFSQYGTITSCNLVLDKVTGTSKGFGFVEMASEDEGKIAIHGLNGRLVQKNKIRVKQAAED